MKEEQQEKLYAVIEKMAIWDEPRERIIKKATVNGFTEEDAEKLYQQARAHRVSLIRKDAWKHLLQGGVLLAITLVCFKFFLALLGGFSLRLSIPFMLSAVLGCLRSMQGLIGWLFAHRKRGSLADDAGLMF